MHGRGLRDRRAHRGAGSILTRELWVTAVPSGGDRSFGPQCKASDATPSLDFTSIAGCVNEGAGLGGRWQGVIGKEANRVACLA